MNELIEFLYDKKPLFHGFGPIRFARMLESGLILPSGNSWGNPYSDSEIYFTPRWLRAAEAYATENFETEMRELSENAQGRKTPQGQRVAIEALAKINELKVKLGSEKIGFVIELNLPKGTMNLQMGNPIEAYRTYKVMFDEDCLRLDTNHNPLITKKDIKSSQRGIAVEFLEDLYVVGKGRENTPYSLKRKRRIERVPEVFGETNWKEAREIHSFQKIGKNELNHQKPLRWTK